MNAFATRAEFHAWLENEGLAHVGRLNLEIVAPYLDQNFWPTLRTLGARRRLSDLASRDGINASLEWLKPSPLREALISAVVAFIDAETQATERARAQLAERQRKPSDTRAAAVFSRLMQLRTRMPPNVAPRLTDLLDHDALEFSESLPGFIWKDVQPTEMPLRKGGGFARPVVKLTLKEGALASTCTCGAMACVHQLAAIDTALLKLDSLKDHALDELARPAWQRTLESLKAAVTATPARATGLITFRISVPGDEGVEVTAWVDNELAKPELLLGRAGSDAPLVSLLPERGDFAPRALLEGLVDSNRVFLARDPSLQVRIERVTVGLIADERGGAITLNAGIEGATFPPYLQERVRTAHADDTSFIWDEGSRRLTLLDVRPEVRAALDVLSKDAGHFPPEAHAQLLETLSQMAHQVPVAMPRSVLGESVPVLRIPVL
ncbi:MAG: ATP-dependent helicase, partial [Archangium sp.]